MLVWWRLIRGLGRPAGGFEVQALEVKPRVISPRLPRLAVISFPVTDRSLGRHQEIHISLSDFSLLCVLTATVCQRAH